MNAVVSIEPKSSTQHRTLWNEAFLVEQQIMKSESMFKLL